MLNSCGRPKKELVLFFFVLFLTLSAVPAPADDLQLDPSFHQNSVQYSRANVILVKRSENLLFSQEDSYVVTATTKFKSQHPDSSVQSLSELTFPCRVSLRYRRYAEKTESVPYPPKTKILEQITLVGSVRAGQSDKRTREQE